MTYVIKEVCPGKPSYVVAGDHILHNGFSFTSALGQATAYTNIAEAIQAIVDRTVFVYSHNDTVAPTTKFTIVRVEQIIKQPEFMEVPL